MPTFSDLDSLYKTTVCNLPANERLLYCNRRLATAKILLDKHMGVMDSYQKNQLRSLISAIQSEIKQIGK